MWLERWRRLKSEVTGPEPVGDFVLCSKWDRSSVLLSRGGMGPDSGVYRGLLATDSCRAGTQVREMGRF